MKIAKLTGSQFKLFLHNVPVLVYSDTGEGVMSDGQLRTITKDETLAVIKASKRHELFSIAVDNRPCHFVRGREFIARELARKAGGSVQVRAPNGQMLLTFRPRHPAHDILRSHVTPIESARPHQISALSGVTIGDTNKAFEVPEPGNCPICSTYVKPTGCREDEHHPYCKFHDAYEAMIPKEPKPAEIISEADKVSDAETLMIIDLETSEPLRTATAEEIEESRKNAEESGFPTIERQGKTYAVATTNLVSE